MSSEPLNDISTSDMKMLQSVLDSAGYDANVLVEDQRLFNSAALLVMKLFRAGETSPFALRAHLDCNFGTASENLPAYKSLLAKYAIQGLPRKDRKFKKIEPAARAKRQQSDIQNWENEGGAVDASVRTNWERGWQCLLVH